LLEGHYATSRTMALGSTPPTTEMSTRVFLRGKGRPARKADNLTTICDTTLTGIALFYIVINGTREAFNAKCTFYVAETPLLLLLSS
jgi:hypothetical protein